MPCTHPFLYRLFHPPLSTRDKSTSIPATRKGRSREDDIDGRPATSSLETGRKRTDTRYPNEWMIASSSIPDRVRMWGKVGENTHRAHSKGGWPRRGVYWLIVYIDVVYNGRYRSSRIIVVTTWVNFLFRTLNLILHAPNSFLTFHHVLLLYSS